MNKLSHIYNQLGKRDQKALAILSLFALSLFVYFFLLKPSIDYKVHAIENFEKELNLSEWIKQNIDKINTITQLERENTQQPNLDEKPLISEVSNLLKTFSLNTRKIQPNDMNNEITLWFEDAQFNNLIKFINHTETQTNLVLIEASINSLSPNKPGQANATLIFTRNK